MSLCWVSFCWVSHFINCYAECGYAECRYAGCRYAECRGALCNPKPSQALCGICNIFCTEFVICEKYKSFWCSTNFQNTFTNKLILFWTTSLFWLSFCHIMITEEKEFLWRHQDCLSRTVGMGRRTRRDRKEWFGSPASRRQRYELFSAVADGGKK